MVLVVEDDPALNRLITTLLVEQGFQVTSVVDGEEAYRAIKSKTVDLMVLDLHLPGVNGAELLVLLNAEHRRVPVIVVSSPTQFESANLKRFTNVRKQIRKPFRNDEIVQSVRDVLEV